MNSVFHYQLFLKQRGAASKCLANQEAFGGRGCRVIGPHSEDRKKCLLTPPNDEGFIFSDSGHQTVPRVVGGIEGVIGRR